YGALLKDEIEKTLKSGTTMFALYIGHGDYEKGLKKIMLGKQYMEAFIPPEFREEMQGMADALADAGSDLTYDDIVMWNTINDSKMLDKGPCSVEDNIPPGRRIPYFPQGGCMTVCAWGDATRDGSMIVGKNMDWYSTPEMRENPIVLVVQPTDGGYAYLTPVYPGWIACIEGMNEKGVAMGMQISRSDVETMKGLGWHFLTALILKYADSVDDAINILTVYPRACGEIFEVCDAKTNKTVVVEVTANDLALRFPEKGKDILWTTNHFNCLPGWQGYNGPVNMPSKQVKAYKLDLTSIETWQKTLPSWSTGRYNRTRELLTQNYGKMTVEKMIQLVSERYSTKFHKYVDWELLDADCIADMWAKDKVLSENVRYYKSERTGPLTYSGACVWSLVMKPLTGDLRIAMAGPVPAQRGEFKYLNLFEELRAMR
ncbi:MAG: hypothetical protein GXO73_06500, partial [Calditrichaeota bacterium]|nr:hypothetical protein [Calditrichota bacterium]